MPAYMAHYACGVRAWHTLQDGTLKQTIRRHPAVYDLGLAGPDLFFYSLGDRLLKAEIGSEMHKIRTGQFLREMYSYAMERQGEEQDICLAYLAGFLGHYSLDTACHPLVFEVCGIGPVESWIGRHYRFEAEMDNRACERVLGRKMKDSHQMGLLRLRAAECRAVAGQLASCIKAVYPDRRGVPVKRRMYLILREYYLLTGVLIDPTGMKEWLLYGLEKRIAGWAVMSPLFINSSSYHVSEELTDAFFRQFHKGVKRDAALLRYLSDCLECGTKCRTDKLEKFFSTIGNLSYHFGKTIEWA